MSANRALVNSLELFMDGLYDNFQDYLKKSLILLSVGVGTVLLMLGYLVKMLNSQPVDVQARQSRSHRRRSSTSSNQSHSSGHTTSINNSKDRHNSHSKRHPGSHSNTSVQSYSMCCQIIKKDGETISSSVSSCPSCSKNKLNVERQSVSNIVTATNKSVCMPSCPSCCSNCIHCLPQIYICPSSKTRPRKSSPGPKKKKHLTKSRQSFVKLKPPNSCCSMCCNHDKDTL